MKACRPSVGIRVLSCCIACCFLTAPAASPADEQVAVTARDPLPPGSLTAGALYTEDYWEGAGSLILPLYFYNEGLFFLNPRSSRTDNSATEFNLGIGFRQLIRDRLAIAGGSLYYDYRDTAAGAQFHQFGAGIEYLSRRLDARANVYIPTDTRRKVNEFTTTEEHVSRSSTQESSAVFGTPYAEGTDIVQPFTETVTTRTRTTSTTTTRFYEQHEIALRGWDAEIGTELPIPAIEEYIRIKPFAGMVNYYGRSGVPDIEAFRGRLEVHIRPSLFIDAVYLSDNKLSGGNFAFGAYLTLPFDIARISEGRNPFAGATGRWAAGAHNEASWRLTETVKRDPQIRAAVAEPEEKAENRIASSTTSTETITRQSSSEAAVVSNITFVDRDNEGNPDQDGTAENPYESIGLGIANANSPVWVFDSSAPYMENVEVPSGVQLYGNGATLQLLGGQTWGGNAHPVVIAPDRGPVISLLGDNTAVCGFDIRHSRPSGETIVIDEVMGSDVTFAGIHGSQVSGFRINENIMADGSLAYGIVIANDGTMPGGSMNLIGSIAGNSIQQAGNGAIYVHGRGGSGIFDVDISGDYSFNSNGIFVDANGYDAATSLLRSISANSNNNGINVYLQNIDGQSLIALRDITANGNRSDGLANLYASSIGAGADAIVDLQDITANNNGDRGIDNVTARTSGSNGEAVIRFDNVLADGNARDGIEDITASSDAGGSRIEFNNVTAINTAGDGIEDLRATAHGVGADAVIILNGVVANNNDSEGIRRIDAYANGEGGRALILLQDVTASHNLEAGIERIKAEAFGAGGDAALLLQDVTVSDNRYNGISDIHTDSHNGGDAVIMLQDVAANDNTGRGLDNIIATGHDGTAYAVLSRVEANDNAEFGIDYVIARSGSFPRGGAGATVEIFDVRADNNGYAGIFEILAETREGNASILLDSVQANQNTRYGIEYVWAKASRDQANANVTVRNIQASENEQQDGIYQIMARADGEGGDAHATLQNIIADHNGNNGIRRVEATAYAGAASINLSAIHARFNADYGIDRIQARADGAGADAAISFIDSDLRDNASGGFNVLDSTVTGGGSEIEEVQNVLQ